MKLLGTLVVVVLVAWLMFFGGTAKVGAAAGWFFAGVATTVAAIGLFDLFVFGSFAFWLLAATTVGCIFYFEDDEESGIGMFITLLACFLLLQFFGDIKIFTAITHQRWYVTLLYVVTYLFPIGVGWSGFKYYKLHRRYLEENRENLVSILRRFLRDNNIDSLAQADESMRKQWERVLEYGRYQDMYVAQPKPKLRDSWKEISHWILYWPVSAFWYVCGEFIKDVLKAIKENLRGFYLRVERYAYRGVLDESVKASGDDGPTPPSAVLASRKDDPAEARP